MITKPLKIRAKQLFFNVSCKAGGNASVEMLRPNVVLDLLATFTSYATHKGKQRIKIIARYQ